MVKESKSLNSISTEGGFFNFLSRLLVEFVVELTTCGKMNGCFGTSALYTSEDNVNLQLYTDFYIVCILYVFFQIKPFWHRVETEQHVRVMLHHLVPDKS